MRRDKQLWVIDAGGYTLYFGSVVHFRMRLVGGPPRRAERYARQSRTCFRVIRRAGRRVVGGAELPPDCTAAPCLPDPRC